METIRAFIAIPLPEPVLDELTALQHRLGRRIPSRSVLKPTGAEYTPLEEFLLHGENG